VPSWIAGHKATFTFSYQPVYLSALRSFHNPGMFMLALARLDVLALRWGADNCEMDPSRPAPRTM
jgi:hypothetical protein